MAKRNALLEWLDQTKKLAKSRDYAMLNLIDNIFEVIWYIDRKIILRHHESFDDVCNRYHKPNPVDVARDRRITQNSYSGIKKPPKDRRQSFDGICPPKGCPVHQNPKKCFLTKSGISLLNKFMESAIVRVEESQKEILWQWFEIIDFMFERPELINPKAIDEYVEERINYVCSTHRKNNPLKHSIRDKFGKSWMDDMGHWQHERRRRF